MAIVDEAANADKRSIRAVPPTKLYHAGEVESRVIRRLGRTSSGAPNDAVAMIAVAVITFLAYLPTLASGFIWDDDYHVTNNLTLRSFHGLYRIWFEPGAVPQYYPLTHTSFWVEYHLWELRPLGYHLDNVLLQAASAVLLGVLLRRLAVRGAWLAALVWAIHPVQVESVAWVSERKNLLSGCFFLLAALAYCNTGAIPNVPADGRSKLRWYALSLGLFTCALLSKTVTATLPAAVLVVLWWKRGRLLWRDAWPLMPMFLAGLVTGSVTGWMERNHVGARGPEWNFPIGDRMLIAGRALWFYAGKLIWPVRQQFIYQRWTLDTSSVAQWLAPVGAVAVIVTLWAVRHRIGRAPLAAVLLFAGTLTPALGFVDTYPMRYSFVADHFQYLAGAWLIALAAAGLSRVPAAVRVALVPLIASTLLVLTVRRERAFHDPVTVWQDVLSKQPDNWIANNNYGDLLLKQGQPDVAERHFAAAVASYPYAAEAWLSLGSIAEQRKQYVAALGDYTTAVRERPDSAAARYDLANMLAVFDRFDDAVVQYEQCLMLNPDMAEAHGNLGVALLRLGRVAEARQEFEQALKLHPDSKPARIELDKLNRKSSPSAG